MPAVPRANGRSIPLNFSEMRRAAWDVHARVKDMDLDGIWASLCFPSGAWGFTGRVLSMNSDEEVGLAAIRAWNSWMIEEWHGAYPERFIPMQLPWLKDPKIAAEEIHRNAERGFTSVSFLESPHLLKLPPITRQRHWEPFFKACEETDTVISLHCGASGFVLQGSPGGGLNVQTSLFPATAYCAAVDWVWAGIPALYPNLKIALSEGGIGWVPMAINRLDYVIEHSGAGGDPWAFDVTPSEALRRNFYFCMIDDPGALRPAPHDRYRPHHVRDRFPARGLHLADLAGVAAQAPVGHPSARGRDDRRWQRSQAVSAARPAQP